MLMLGRKEGERIRIGENVVVWVVEIRKGRVLLGIDAPRETPIYRQEIDPRNDQQGGE